MFRVEWLRSALEELTEFWTKADSNQRKIITKASHFLEQELQINAPNLGESRPKECRIAFVPPLAVTFRIESDGKTVTVVHVRAFWRRK
jgi:hypothetical protein